MKAEQADEECPGDEATEVEEALKDLLEKTLRIERELKEILEESKNSVMADDQTESN